MKTGLETLEMISIGENSQFLQFLWTSNLKKLALSLIYLIRKKLKHKPIRTLLSIKIYWFDIINPCVKAKKKPIGTLWFINCPYTFFLPEHLQLILDLTPVDHDISAAINNDNVIWKLSIHILNDWN